MNQNLQHPAGRLNWKVFFIALLSFAICIVSSSLDTWISFRSDTCFKNTAISNIVRGTSIVFTGISLLFPTLFFMYYATQLTNVQEIDKHSSKIQVCIIGFVCNIFTIISSSLGLWLLNNAVHFSSNVENDATKYTLIISIVVALVLPILFTVFLFHKKFVTDAYSTHQ